MILNKLLVVLFLAGVISACQLPSPTGGGPSVPSPSVPGSSPPPSPGGSPPSAPGSEPPAAPGDAPPAADGSEGEAGSPPPAGDADGAGAGMPSPEGATAEGGGDTLESLDEQLDEALEDFDATVMGGGSAASDEMTDILDPLNNSAGTQSDAPLFEEADLGEAGDSVENASIAQRAAEGGSGGGGEPASAGEQAGAGGGQDGNDSADIIPIPDDVGDGRNDDIVLRQIRDAAMKEHDETLREKLWDEYRRIKGQ